MNNKYPPLPPPPPNSNNAHVPTPPPPPRMTAPPPPPPPPLMGKVPTAITTTTVTSSYVEEDKLTKTSSVKRAFKFYDSSMNDKFFDKTYSPNRIVWNKVGECHLSSNPTSGVFIVETQNRGEYVVIKGTSTICQELFGSLICSQIGLYTPRTTVIEYLPASPSTEWRMIKQTLSAKNIGRRANKELDRAFFILMEFVEHAVGLDELSVELIPIVLSNESVLRDLGRMIVVDIVLNNWDRIPIDYLWKHDGNAGNVLFSIVNSSNHVKLAMIDQCISKIHVNNIPNYLHKVDMFMEDICDHKNDPQNSIVIQNICQFLKNSTENIYNFTQQDCMHLMSGIHECIEQMKRDGWSDQSRIKLWKDQVDAMKSGHDWADVWKNGMDCIDIAFLKQVIDRIVNY